ncbi:MAG: cyclase family protein [Alphaproteobacteria bacterium]|nr:MAG: cyclase family protein [Alphaproteobacteria bacterium]
MSKDGAVLSALVEALSNGTVKVVDLTETLRPDYPVIALPPQFGQASPFIKEEISRYDEERGPAWYWNNITLSEHTGTHFDAPIHWVTGKDLPNNATDTIDPSHFVAPVCVIDCSKEAAADQDFILTRDFLENWEKEYGEIPAGSWVFMRTDWRKIVSPDNWTNVDADGNAHHPGPDKEAVEFLIERDVMGFGTECVGTDHAGSFGWDVPLPCHTLIHGAGKYGLQCMTNLDQLPPKGAVVIAPPLKIEEGSGSPLRVLALVPA